MKRCPLCGTTYTDHTLVYCLQDGAMLVTVSDSASADPEATWVGTGARSRDEPPPTEVMRPEDFPTARINEAPATKEQQRARPTALDTPESRASGAAIASRDAGAAMPSHAPPRTRTTSTPVIILSVAVVVLLLVLGGLVTWVMMRERQTNEPRAGVTNLNQNGAAQTQSNTRANSNSTSPGANASPQPSAVDLAAAQREVGLTINDWANSIGQREIDEHMKFYAPQLEVYYNQTNVSADRVRADRERAFDLYDSMSTRLSNVKINVERSGTRATATFDKTFDFKGEKNFSGSVESRLNLTKSGGRWRITGEKDLQTYYINK